MSFNFDFSVNEPIDSTNILNTISSSIPQGSTESTAASMVLGGLAGFMLFFVIMMGIIGFVVIILKIIATWKIFVKAGQAGWKCLIPIYNTVVLYKIAGISPLWVLSYLAACIPVLGPLFILGVSIYAMVNLSRAFGKEDAFAVGLVLLNTIFTMILGFGKSEYVLNKKDDIKEAEVVEEIKNEK